MTALGVAQLIVGVAFIAAALVGLIAYLEHREKMVGVLDTQVRRLRLEPGDRIIVTVPTKLSADQSMELRRQVEEFLPGVPVVVIHGMTLSVTHPPEPPATPGIRRPETEGRRAE